jgi:hypothetical protein
MVSVPYDPAHAPPAPVLDVVVSNPLAGLSGRTQLMVDSGAEQTVQPYQLLMRLQVPLGPPVAVYGFGGAGMSLMECDVEIALPGCAPELVAVLTGPANLHYVLGRDVLNRYRVVLDGPNQRLEIG